MKLTHCLAAPFILAALSLTSCKNDGMTQQSEMKEALLVWSGEYMVDGCGFHVVIDDRQYKPEDEEAILEEFKVEEPQPVLLSYDLTGETIDRRCGLSTESKAMPGIRIKSIQRRN
jgi:hypothetical protein